MKKNKNYLIDEAFENLPIKLKCEVLNITEETLALPKFRGMSLEQIISDEWLKQTNSQKRKLILETPILETPII